MNLIQTPSQTSGPYLHIGLTTPRSVGRIAGPKAKGERLWLVCRVIDGDGALATDAMIEIWQADADGKYHHPEDMRLDEAQEKIIDPSFRGFGRLATGEDGSCEFETIKPGRVPGNGNTLQAPHLNVSVFARGLLKRLATRIYFAADPANLEDSILALVPKERRGTLMAKPDSSRPNFWRFDIRLSGQDETVFFEI